MGLVIVASRMLSEPPVSRNVIHNWRIKGTEFRSKAEAFARKLVRNHKEQVQRLTLDGGCANIDEMV